MESDDGYLCDLCSEIYRYGGELIDHMMDDHDLDNFVICEFPKSDNNNYISQRDSSDPDDKMGDECVDELPDIPYHPDNNVDDPDYIPEPKHQEPRSKKTLKLDKTRKDSEKLSEEMKLSIKELSLIHI